GGLPPEAEREVAATRERTWHLGRPRLRRRASAGRPPLCRGQRRAADAAEARNPVPLTVDRRVPRARGSRAGSDRRGGRVDVRSRQDVRAVVALEQGTELRRPPAAA